MDKTIQLVVVAMIVLISGMVLGFILNDGSSDFGEFLDNQQKDSQCQIQWERYKSELDCDATQKETSASSDIKNKWRSECESTGRPFDANEIC